MGWNRPHPTVYGSAGLSSVFRGPPFCLSNLLCGFHAAPRRTGVVYGEPAPQSAFGLETIKNAAPPDESPKGELSGREVSLKRNGWGGGEVCKYDAFVL